MQANSLPIRKNVESEMNRVLAKSSLEAHWEGWKWVVIAILVSKEFNQDYPERLRRNAKNKVLEFRLKFDHDAFVKSSVLEQLAQYFLQLRRSVELMAKWKMSPKDRSILANALKEAEAVLVRREFWSQESSAKLH